jgi:hypothetical protein
MQLRANEPPEHSAFPGTFAALYCMLSASCSQGSKAEAGIFDSVCDGLFGSLGLGLVRVAEREIEWWRHFLLSVRFLVDVGKKEGVRCTDPPLLFVFVVSMVKLV